MKFIRMEKKSGNGLFGLQMGKKVRNFLSKVEENGMGYILNGILMDRSGRKELTRMVKLLV